MGKRTVQTIVGWLIVIGHFGLILFILIFKDKDWDIAVKQSAILTISPVTVSYLVAVVKAWIDGQKLMGSGETVNFNYVGIAILIPALLLSFLFYTINAFPAVDFVKPEQLQQWLAAGEIGFGGTVGYIIADLFKMSSEAIQQKPPNNEIKGV